MGVNHGGIAININTDNIDLLKVANDIFGDEFEVSDSFCDSRQNNCVHLLKTKESLIILNYDFASNFFQDNTTNTIQSVLDCFSNPKFIFAFEEYDSGGTYSYSLIYDGIVKRKFRSVTYETTIDFGELEAIEVKWKNAEKIITDLGNGEFETLLKDPTKDFSCTELSLPHVILQELMHEKLGFISWDLIEFVTEHKCFERKLFVEKIGNKQDNLDSKNRSKKTWWKIW